MNFLFLMDPLETVKMKSDTSYIFMVGAADKGHRTFYLPSGGITLKNGSVSFTCTEVKPVSKETFPFEVIGDVTLDEQDVDAVFIRTDPPFDNEYLMNTWLLDRVSDKVAVINNPTAVRSVNEKIWATQFTELIPRTVISRHLKDFKEFLDQEGEIIIKPTDGFGGSGVFRISKEGSNKNVSFEVLSDRGKQEVIMQQYIPEAAIGDKRILLLNGEPLGAVLRVHGADDHRNNFYAGGKPVACEITKRDKEVIEALKPHLQAMGLYFVGIDMLGDYLIEVNVTSPTCLQEMNSLYDCKLHHKVIEFAEKLVESKNKCPN
ncbi:MAG: glutathione synthase [Lentisphaeraceae bacterium]|nr:glutathione synthase [Lentisphaeraceae bacterium]